MYNEWSLDVLYKGIDDPALAEGMARLEELIAAYKQAVAELGQTAMLAFYIGSSTEDVTDKDGHTHQKPAGKLVLNGNDVASAEAMDAIRVMILRHKDNEDHYAGIPIETCLDVLE